MSEYDVYLNGKGYMLAKDPSGQLQSGAAREQHTNPFTRHLSMDEQYIRVPFLFGDGAGCAFHDGSHRYESGEGIDTRSGKVLVGPARHMCETIGATEFILAYNSSLSPVYVGYDQARHAVAQKFQAATGKTAIRTVHVLIELDTSTDYSTATTFTIEIYDDSSGLPGSSLGSKTISPKADPDPTLPWPDRWRARDWFWIEATFASDIAITAGNYYWMVIKNLQWPPLKWGEDTVKPKTYYRSIWNGSTWGTATQEYPLAFKVKYADQIDGLPRAFCEFAGVDTVKRLYAAVRNKVMYCAEPALTWADSTVGTAFVGGVMQMLVFNSKMFVAQGSVGDMWHFDGTTATTTWTQVTGHQANALAIHDNMLWKADVASVNGSADGTAWAATAVVVGDPGTPVQAMVSHGGKLFCAKPEGIFEISYPDTYPGTGAPTANQMLDFHTELAPRTWLLDWHSGLYFPGYGGVYELRGGVLRNAFTDKIDEGAMEISTGEEQYTRPSRWSPIYDARPGGWAYAVGTTRGIWLAYSDPHLNPSDIWCYDGRSWHQMGPTANLYGVWSDPLYKGEYTLALYLQDVGGGRGRLWFGRGTNIGYMYVPTWTNDRSQDSLADYDQYGIVYLPRYSMAEKNKSVALCKLGVTTRGVSETYAMGIYYRIDGGAWTTLGTITTSPYQEKSFPVGTSGREIQLGFEINDASRLDQVDLLIQPMPEVTTVHQLILLCASGIDRVTGGPDQRTAKEILAELRSLVGLGNFTYIDPEGTSHTARVTGLTVQRIAQRLEPGATPPLESYAILSLLEL